MTIDPTQEALYNVRAMVPDHLNIFADWRDWSAGYRKERPEAQYDLSYGTSASETLDYYPPTSPQERAAPLVLLIHGGYWQAMDKSDNSFAARALCDAGCAVAVVNHTLCPAVSLDVIIDQIRRASLWLWQQATSLRFSPTDMFVIGHSAGGHLAAMMLCTKWQALAPKIPAPLFKAGVSISGLFDLSPLVHTSINDKVGMTEQSAKTLSPTRHTPQCDTTLLTAVGGTESAGFHEQVKGLQQNWAQYDIDVDYMNVANCHHFQVYEKIADKKSELFKAIFSLIFSNEISL